jgi:hypothetical protein
MRVASAPAAIIRTTVEYESCVALHDSAITAYCAKYRAANGPCCSTLACIPGNGTNDGAFRRSRDNILTGGSTFSRPVEDATE